MVVLSVPVFVMNMQDLYFIIPASLACLTPLLEKPELETSLVYHVISWSVDLIAYTCSMLV